MTAPLRLCFGGIIFAVLLTGFLEEMDGVNAGMLPPEMGRCEPIILPMCRSVVPWNHTRMPNQFLHETQQEAAMEAHQFWPLANTKCHEDIVMFLCSMYTPVCMESYPKPVPVCRSVCLRVRSTCQPIMEQYGFPWPERMQCDQFPIAGDEQNLCMDWNATKSSEEPERRPLPPTTPANADHSAEKCPCTCPASNFDNEDKKSKFGGIPGCSSSCRSYFPTRDEWKFMEYWIGLWTVACAVLTTFALLTFMLDRQRFQYPERPIVLVTFCYLMVSLGFALRLYFGHEAVACDGNISRQNDVSNWMCTVVFVLLYYFGMASCIWWVILSMTWYLASGREWSSESISEISKWFHVLAWGLPMGFTATVLGFKAVGGDPVAGVCYVGHHDLHHLMAFVVAPISVYLVIGVTFLVLGLWSLCTIRRKVEFHDKEKSQRFRHQMSRIGMFSFCTLLPFATLLGCNMYELMNREEWEKALICDCNKNSHQPHIPVFIIKYLAMLVVGITSAIWFINRKTFRSWANVLCKRCSQPNSTKSSEFTLLKPGEVLSHRPNSFGSPEFTLVKASDVVSSNRFYKSSYSAVNV